MSCHLRHFKPLSIYFTAVVLIIVSCSFNMMPAAAAEKKVPKWMTGNYLSMGWSTAAPLWHTLEQTEAISLTGAELSFQLRLRKTLSVGPDIHWQLFDGIPGISNRDSSTFSAWNEKRFLCAALTAQYYFFKRDTMLPYLGLGIGGMRVREKRGLMAEHSSDASWHGLAAPEIGMYLLHGRIPVWLSGRLLIGIPATDSEGEMMMILTLGISVPN